MFRAGGVGELGRHEKPQTFASMVAALVRAVLLRRQPADPL
jgi:hypothetical protein